jgi:nitrate/nitrite-specific signal transduction histidine kinase
MLNLSQRLILGFALMAALTLGLVAAARHALLASGQSGLAWWFVAGAVVVALGTVYFVLQPIQKLARDAQKIAQGNLDHRSNWKSATTFGVLAAS